MISNRTLKHGYHDKCKPYRASYVTCHATDHDRICAPVVSKRCLNLSTLSMSLLAFPQKEAVAALIDENLTMKVFEEASPSVVSIINYKFAGGVKVPEGVGTGVVWDSLGHIVTNYHVISKIDKGSISQSTKVVAVDPGSGQSITYSVELLGSDAMHDLAALRIVPDVDSRPEEEGASPSAQSASSSSSSNSVISSILTPMKMGSSSDLKVGQYVFAIGNTYGLTKTLSVGILSGLNRSIPSPVGTRIYGVLQTDASINAGNSGGPLLDSSGRMVGMNTSTITRAGTGRGSGVNFALPADLLRDAVPKLIVYGNSMGQKV